MKAIYNIIMNTKKRIYYYFEKRKYKKYLNAHNAINELLEITTAMLRQQAKDKGDIK